MSVLCCYCKKNFSDEYKVERHQKTAKYCIEIQNKKKESITCQDCEKKFYSERELRAHSCKGILYQLREEINSLRLELNELKSRRKIVKVLPLTPLTDDMFPEIASHLVIDDIIKGPYSLATFALKHIFLGKIVCTDISRRKIRYKPEKDQLCTDYKMIDISVKFFTAIKSRAFELINEMNKKNREKIKLNEMNCDEEDDFFEDLIKYGDIKTMINEGSCGINNKHVSDFIEIICSKVLPKE